MRKNPIVLLGAIAAIMVVCVYAGAQADRARQARPCAIAVVDVSAVFNALDEKPTIDAARDKLRREMKAENDRRVQEINQLKEDRDLLQPGPAFQEKQRELELAAIELQALQEYQKRRLISERALQTERIYSKITDALGAIAQAEGYDVVLFKERPIDFRAANPQQIDALVALRKVLWSKPDLDITAQVTDKMNNDFNNAPE